MATRSGRASVAPGIELAYDVFGTSGRPLVLIMGIGAQRCMWDDALCTQFANAGFHVARFDHRDIGESSRLDAPVPKPARVLALRLLGVVPRTPYTLSDMASDVASLIRELGFGRAHVVGTSLGGMVAQHLAIEHPEVVRSLTSIMSTPGGRRYLPQPHALKALFMKPPRTAEEAGRAIEATFRVIGSTAWEPDGARLRGIGELAFTRGLSPRGFLRHFAAVLGTADRRPKLRASQIPTLVIHGSRDPMFPMRAGRDLVRMMPHATWLPITGMGHDLPSPMWPVFVSAITRHAALADARAIVQEAREVGGAGYTRST